MAAGGMQCSGCGSTDVTFEPQTRTCTCNQCGKREYYSRATLNSNGKVVFGKQNAINFFREGQFENADHYAKDVLNISMDNAPALFIIAYYDEFVTKRLGAMKQFFATIADVALEYDEVEALMDLVVAGATNLADWEEDIIKMLAMNMQSPSDAQKLGDVIDKICPYFIAKRTSSAFLTAELADMYRELAGHCGICKTCYALIKSIETNPDSPNRNGSFFLKTRTQHFYESYVLPIGTIVNAMSENEYKSKFIALYNSKKSEYEAKMN